MTLHEIVASLFCQHGENKARVVPMKIAAFNKIVTETEAALNDAVMVKQGNADTIEFNKRVIGINRSIHSYNARVSWGVVFSPISYRRMPYRRSTQTQAVLGRKNRLVSQLSNRKPEQWIAELSKLPNGNVRDMVTRVVWWDYYRNAPEWEEFNSLIDWSSLKDQVDVDVDVTEFIWSLHSVGYHPYDAVQRGNVYLSYGEVCNEGQV